MNHVVATLVEVLWPIMTIGNAACGVFSGEIAAAWVQAVGSVVAILVAAWLPGRQRRRELSETGQAARVTLRQAVRALRDVAAQLRQASTSAALAASAQDGAGPLRLVLVAVQSYITSAAHDAHLQEVMLLAAYRLGNAANDLASTVAPLPSKLVIERDRLAKNLEDDADAIERSI